MPVSYELAGIFWVLLLGINLRRLTGELHGIKISYSIKYIDAPLKLN
jgi:hypothetical protein